MRYPAGRAADRRASSAALTARLLDDQPWAVPAYLCFGAIGVALAGIDLDTKRLPDVLTLPSYAVMGALLLLPAIADDHWSCVPACSAGRPRAVRLLLRARCSSSPAAWAWVTSSSPASLGLVLGWLGWGGARRSAASWGSCSAASLGVALMAGRSRRPQVQDPVRAVHDCRRAPRPCSGVRPSDRLVLGTSSYSDRLGSRQSRIRVAQPSSPRSGPPILPLTRFASLGDLAQPQGCPREGLASWQDDPPLVSTSGLRAFALPSFRSARARSPSRSSARLPSRMGPCATARSSTSRP